MTGLVLQERYAPSRPFRLGTRRRRAPQGRAVSEPGASRPRTLRPASLDTEKYLATSVANWLKDQETQWDSYQNRVYLWRKLCSTVYGIWQDFASQLHVRPRDGAEWTWWTSYEAEKAALKADSCPAYDAWLDDFVKKRGVPECKEAWLHILYLEHWRRVNRPVGLCARVLVWEKQYFQLMHCQGEWIGYRASCCSEKTKPVAVPIGCNHRLCPLCNWHRSQNAQRKVKQMFDAHLHHPQLITLTIPNSPGISKGELHFLRKKVREFLAGQKRMWKGGVYSIEVTYNRIEKTWHPHAHILVDANFKLPGKDQQIDFAGRRIHAFTFIKLALEYDWARLWIKHLGKKPRKNAARNVIDGERFEFENWVRAGFENRLREFRDGRWQPIENLPAAVMMARREWNTANRRLVDIRPVDDRDKAVKEVLKYITKCSEFADLPECVIAFYDATKSARLIQSFGSWYGLDFGVLFDTKHPEDWSKLECRCGVNHWERMGVFQQRDVRMEDSGRWSLRDPLDSTSRGTIPRPTILALAGQEERTGDMQ